MYTLYSDSVEQYIAQVEKERRPKKNLQDQKWSIAVDDEYLNELLKYDFTSTKKGRGFTSLLVKKKREQKQDGKDNQSQHGNLVKAQKVNDNNEQVMNPPPGV